MNKKIILLVVLFLRIGVFAQEDISSWKQYDKNNYFIMYPDNWELNDSGIMGTKFIFLSPVATETDTFRENVNLVIEALPKGVSLDDYAKHSKSQIEKLMTNAKVISSERVKKDTREYERVIFSASQGVFNLNFIQFYIVEQGFAYVLTFSAETKEFENYKFIGEKVLKSFNFKK